MATSSTPSRASAIVWLLLIFGSIVAIGLYAWSIINRQPAPVNSTKQSTSNEDPNTFNIDEQLDMLN